MSDLLYLEVKMCGCVRRLAMVDDTDAGDIEAYSELIARANRQDPLVLRMERAAWNHATKCAEHKPMSAPEPRP